MKLKDTEKIYIRTMGKMLRITAMFPDSDEGTAQANRLMETSGNRQGVVAVMAGHIWIANLHDKGVPIPKDY